jgi:hypothetical protein
MAVGIRRDDSATTFHPQKLAVTSQTSGDRSVGTVRSRTKATEFASLFAAGQFIDYQLRAI